MKFGHTAERAFGELVSETGLPPFPYKSLKKALKSHAADVRVPADVRSSFIKLLTKETKRVDERWAAAARCVLLVTRTPRVSGAYLMITGRSSWCRDPVAAAGKLDAWAELARTGLRKIIKKYNKRLGSQCGQLAILPGDGIRFSCGCTRTEIESLARRTARCY